MSVSEPKEWSRDEFFISTDRSLLDVDAISAAFESADIYWTKGTDMVTLLQMLDHSLCLGLYFRPTDWHGTPLGVKKQIGFARLITDRTTFAYLTDVYVLAEHKGQGLGTWIVQCVSEMLDSWPALRRCMLITSEGAKGESWYQREMGMRRFKHGEHGLVIMSKNGKGSVWALEESSTHSTL